MDNQLVDMLLRFSWWGLALLIIGLGIGLFAVACWAYRRWWRH